MNDNALRQQVIDALHFEPSIDDRHIGVAATDGVVTLTGHVSSFAERSAAEAGVRRVKGVRGLAQEIQIRLDRENQNTDEEIARRDQRPVLAGNDSRGKGAG